MTFLSSLKTKGYDLESAYLQLCVVFVFVCLFVCLFVCFSPTKLTLMFFFVMSLDFVEQDYNFYVVTRWHHRTLHVIIMCNGHMH